MNKQILISLILLIFYSIGLSFDNEKFINGLKSLYKKELPRSFFVIQASTLLQGFTQSPQLIKRMEEIREYQLCPYVFMIWKDEGGVGKHFYKYLKEHYYIDTNEFVKAYISSELYDELDKLGKNVNTNIHYFYNLKHYIKIDGKYERVQTLLPYDLINIKFDNQYLLADDSLYHTNQVDYFPINDTLAIELYDGHKARVRLTNIITGKVLKVFDFNQIDHFGMFKRYMNYLHLSDEEIRKNNEYLNSIQRSPIMIDRAYIKSINEIYLVGDVRIMHRSPKTKYIPGEFKSETIIVKKGSYTTSNFDIIIKTDTSFKVKDIKFVDEIADNEYNRKHFLDAPGGIYIRDGKYYFYGYNYCINKDKTYKDFYRRNKSPQFIHIFKPHPKNDSLLIFEGKCESRSFRPFEEYYFYLSRIYMFGTEQNMYAVMDVFPDIYSFNESYPVKKISEEKYVYSFAKHNYDSTTIENIPYSIFHPGYILNDHLYAILYRSYDNYILKLFDTHLNVIQQIDMTDLLHLKKEMKSIEFSSSAVVISPNYISTIYCNQEGCYNYRYKIQFNPFNERYFSRAGKFIK